MIAKVIKDNGYYYSHVFAVCNEGFNMAVITFDNKNNKYDFVKMYDGGKRKVFILNCNEAYFENKERIKLNLFSSLRPIKGYPWLLNEDTIRKIIKNQPLKEEYIESAKIENGNILINEWEYVNDEEDVKNLFSAGYNFHDSYISELAYTHNEKRNLKIVFSNCFNATITLLLEGDIKINFEDLEDYDYTIYNASIIFKEEHIYLVINKEIESIDKIEVEDNFFRARTLKWKIETNNF